MRSRPASPSTSRTMPPTHQTPAPRQPRRRADAERSVARILDAAVDALASDPEASMTEIARRAGVVRATIYVHFPTRDALIDAVTERAIAEATATIKAAEPERGDAADALRRVVVSAWRTLDRYHALVAINTQLPQAELHARHRPVLATLRAAHRTRPARRQLPLRRPRRLASLDGHGAHPRRQRRTPSRPRARAARRSRTLGDRARRGQRALGLNRGMPWRKLA